MPQKKQKIKFTINNQTTFANIGETILEAALRAGIYIPNLCYHPDLRPVGACRLCMVNIEGRGNVTACNTPVTPKLPVLTDTPDIEKMRRLNVELLLANHEGNCTECSANTKCELQKIAKYVGIQEKTLEQLIKPKRKLPIDDSNPFFTLDRNKCVLCGICVRTCNELVHNNAIDFVNRGFATIVKIANNIFWSEPVDSSSLVSRRGGEEQATGVYTNINEGEAEKDKTKFYPAERQNQGDFGCFSHEAGKLKYEKCERRNQQSQKPKCDESDCVSCGECTIRCPTAALAAKNSCEPAYEVKTVCPYCGCGCALYLGVRGGKIVSSRGDSTGKSNQGRLCVKGRFGFSFVNSKERLTKPLIRRHNEFVEVSWREALDFVAQHLTNYKGDRFAFFSSARFTNEDNYLAQKFTRAVMQTNNIDHCARLCHAPSVAGLAQTLGSGAMTNSIEEIGDSKCILAIGTNTTYAHPIIAIQVKNAVAKGAHLIVINPLEIDLCRHAEIFLQHRPGTDVALLMGMARIILEENLHDQNFINERCENFAEFKNSLTNFPLDFIAKTTGISADLIKTAARLYAKTKPATILYAMGITQHTHGTDNVIATSNLALLTGNVGKYASGINPLRGQNNVQGACDMGALPDVFTGYQKVTNEAARTKFSQAWQTNLSAKPGLTHTEVLHAIDKDEIEALYIAGENPMLSEADLHHVESALRKVKFLVVQDIFMTETARLAHVVLPATTFAEKDGTFTNTERMVQLLHRAIPSVGEAKNDWQIFALLAKKLGAQGFNFKNSAAIMDEIASLTPSYHGISHKRLEKESLTWPCLDQKHPGTPILHTEKFATPNGKAKLIPLVFKPSAELPDNEYPLLLTTDRSLFHYHTATMTRKVQGLNILHEHDWLEINPQDAFLSLQITDGETVKVKSRRGEISVAIKITETVPPGIVCLTFHFAETPTNVLTNSAVDPVAKIPETKVCAVKIIKG